MTRRLARIFVAVASVFVPAGALASPDKSCQAESILAELDRKDPRKIASILRKAGEVKNSQAMLWRIEKAGVAASHLFGTVHVADPSLAALSPQTSGALRASKLVALEASDVPANGLGAIMAQAGPLMGARDKPLQRELDEDELKVVEKSVMEAGYPAELALGIRPWVATMFLTGSSCQSPADQGKPLDLIVAEEAHRAGAKLVGLETMLEQFQSIAAIDDKAQVAWLKASIATHNRVNDITHTMAELYRFRRIDAVWQLTREMAPAVSLTDSDLAAVREGLVTRRNARLLERSLPHIETGGAFIAVGALHLSGDDGLVESLRQRGFTLHPIE